MTFVDFIHDHSGMEVMLTIQHGNSIGFVRGKLETNRDWDFVQLHHTNECGIQHYRAFKLVDIVSLNTDTHMPFDDDDDGDDDDDDDEDDGNDHGPERFWYGLFDGDLMPAAV